MAITTANQWFSASRQKIATVKTTAITTVAAQPFSLFGVAGNPSAGTLAVGNTTTGVLFTDATAGCPTITTFGSGNTGYLAQAIYRGSVTGGITLYDRIWGAGAISTNTLATTTFSSQPSATGRMPDAAGAGCEILIEITTAVAAAATTVTVGYTNSAGTSGRTTSASTTISGFTVARIIQMPLQAGDVGVQQIDSVTVGGTAAATGAFNVILARRLDDFDVRVQSAVDAHAWDMTGATIVYDTSALWLVSQADGSSSGVPSLSMTIVNG